MTAHPNGPRQSVSSEATTDTGDRRKWVVLSVTSMATLLGTSDFSIVAIIFPELTRLFSASTTTVVWVSLAFQTTMLALVLPAGRIGDLIGRKRVFVGGLIVYTIALALLGASLNIGMLIGRAKGWARQ